MQPEQDVRDRAVAGQRDGVVRHGARTSSALRKGGSALLWLAGVLAAVAAGAQGEATVVHPGDTIEGPLAAGASVEFALEFDRGGAYLLTVDQQGLNLQVTVIGPDNAERVFDSPTARDGDEIVLLEPLDAGRYSFTISNDEVTTVSGNYRIAVMPVTEHLSAWRAMSEGAESNASGGSEQWTRAVAAYDSAATAWAEAGRPGLEAQSLYAAATIDYWQLYAWMPAAERAALAAARFEPVDAGAAANAVHLQAAALVEAALEIDQSDESATGISTAAQAEFDRALVLLESARDRHRRLGNLYDLGMVTNNLGYTHYNMGLLEDARRYYQAAAVQLQDAGETAAELNPRYNLAVLEVEQGFLTAAIESFERILDILPPGELDEYRSWALDALGGTELAFGNAEKALRVLSDALGIQVRLDDRQGQGRSLRRIGQTYLSLGEFELAADYLRQALPIAEQTSDARNREATLRALGNIAFSESRFSDALAFHRQALETAVSLVDRTHLQLLVAQDLRALGRLDEAAVLAEAALGSTGVESSVALTAAAELELGWIRLAGGDLAAADPLFTRSKERFDRLGLVSELADANYGLARSAQAAGRTDAALGFGEVALAGLERMRLRIVNPDRRAQLGATRRRYFETQLELYMSRARAAAGDASRDVEAAFEISERARPRSITETVAVAGDAPPGSDENGALRSRQASLVADLAEKNYRRDLLIDQQRDESDPEYASLLDDMAGLETELDLIEIGLRRADPASIETATPLEFAEVQAALGPDTVLLQYFFGERISLVFVVTDEGVEAIELADRDVIDDAARAALDRLSGFSGAGGSGQPLTNLSHLLIAPVRDRIGGAGRLVVALEGAPQYVPIAVLPFDDAGQSMLDVYDVVEVPSLSTVVAMRKRERASEARRTLAVFADPVMTTDDPRLGDAVAGIRSAALHDLETRLPLAVELDRLPSSAYEAERIGALVPASDRLIARGFDASRHALLTADLRDFRYVHFATHGLVDSRYPGLSALALSSFDASGRRADGFLRLHDIYNLELDADLVVLSACETALGREIRGEGLIGLTQAFMSAGARGVIASRWQVPDRATAELMTYFYSYLLNDGGMEPAAALKQAQRDIAAQRRWRDPYFWGGFVLMGDWR